MVNRRPLYRRILSLSLRIIKRIPKTPYFLASLPFTLVLILLFPVVKIKLIRLCSDRIGHYALNTEFLLCYLDEMKQVDKKTKYVFYTIDAPISNQQLHIMWKRILPFFALPNIAEQVNAAMLFFFGDKYKNNSLSIFEKSIGCQDPQGFLKRYAAHLHFTDAELQRGAELLSNLGIQEGNQFVCLFARDSAYLKTYFPNRDWSYHDYRDCHIENFEKAALFLANQGFFVLRMGKAVSKAFNVNHSNIIDYANHPLRSDFADIYLAAHCHFMISTSSGLDGVAQIFRRPILFVNIAPFNRQLQYWYPCELFIVKKIFDQVKQRYVSLSEINSMLLIENDPRKKLNELNWIVIENNADEILSAVQEMVSVIDKKSSKKTTDQFYRLLQESLSFPMIANYDLLKMNLDSFYIRMGTQFLEHDLPFISDRPLQEVVQ